MQAKSLPHGFIFPNRSLHQSFIYILCSLHRSLDVDDKGSSGTFVRILGEYMIPAVGLFAPGRCGSVICYIFKVFSSNPWRYCYCAVGTWTFWKMPSRSCKQQPSVLTCRCLWSDLRVSEAPNFVFALNLLWTVIANLPYLPSRLSLQTLWISQL